MVIKTMILRPTTIRIFLPAFSIRARETNVMATFMAPMPRVADWLCLLSAERTNDYLWQMKDKPRPAFSKMEVE
jgi:hypothetical protein